MAKKLKRGLIITVFLLALVLGVGVGTAAAASWGEAGIEAGWYE